MTIFLPEEQGESWLKHIQFTTDMKKIERAVYNNNENVINHIVWNPLLTEAHLRHLNPKITYPLYKVFLIQNPAFPVDLLLELSMTTNPDFEGHYIKAHPNATEEIKVIVALRLAGLGLR